MLAGICAGAAEYFGLDVTLVRVIMAVFSVIPEARAAGWPAPARGAWHAPGHPVRDVRS